MSLSNVEREWWVITFEVVNEEAESFADLLREKYDLDPVELERPESDHTWIECYFDDEDAARDWLDRLAQEKPVRAQSLRRCAAKDWSTFWRLHFKAGPVGDRLWCRPEWEPEAVAPDGRTTLIMSPGLSFGTGDHFTTRFCMEAIEQWAPPGPCRSMWDAGCGSGILGIAGALLGMDRVLGTDFDPYCVSHARENAQLNGVADVTEWRQEDITVPLRGDRKMDLVCANLFSSLLIQVASTLWNATGKQLVLSGIRESEVDEVAEAFSQRGARERVRDGDGEWAGLVFDRV